MPASDNCEPQIINALEKDGWEITDRPFSIKFDDTYIYADLRLERNQGENIEQIIVVEIKCFPFEDTYDFHQAVGQYISYETALRKNGKPETIFLAIPIHAYARFQRNNIMSAILQEKGVKLIIVDLESEVIEQWIT